MDDLTTIVPDEAPETDKPRRKKRGGLFVTDAELIERLCVPEKVAREALRILDRDRTQGFPPKHKFWGDRRYWPAVKDYFDQKFGLKIRLSSSQEGRNGR